MEERHAFKVLKIINIKKEKGKKHLLIVSC